MKVLKLSTLLCLLLSSLAYANSSTLDNYISENKQEQFKYSYDKNSAESSKLRDSWISPVQINYSLTKSKPFTQEQTNQNAAIKMDQPIFQSGGIYYGIKFANASKLYSDLSVDVAKRKMIKETIAILMQIKQASLSAESQKLKIENSRLNLEQKQEQYLSGQLDSGFLDDAIITQNIIIQTLYDIETSKQKLITKFETFSDLDYSSINIPHLELINNNEFIKNNIVLQQSKAEIEKNRNYKNVTIAKYLPRISLTAGYNWQKSENRQFTPDMPGFTVENSYYDYGLRASMPIDLNIFRDIESSRVDYLKSKIMAEDKVKELNALFKQVTQNIENFNKKIILSNENIKIYERLLADTKDLYESGYKTKNDIDILQNSLNIQSYSSKMYELDKQIELLTLYEMYVNSGE